MADQTHHLGQLILDNLANSPDAILQIDGRTGVSETKGLVRERSIRVARHMKKIGIREKDVITICTFNDNDTCLPFIASFYIGACVSGLDMKMSKLEYAHILSITNPRLLFCDPAIAQTFDDIIEETNCNTRIVVFGESRNKSWASFSEYLQEDDTEEEFKVTPIDPEKNLAYILCSSGSTGLPKGVCHSHKRLVQHVEGGKRQFDKKTMIQFSSIYWLSGLAMTLLNLLSDAVRVNAAPFETETFFEYVEKYKANFLVVTPSVVRMILSHPGLKKANLDSINVLMVTGATVDFDELSELQKYVLHGKVLNSYGLSEMGGPVTYTLGELKRGSAGKIIPYVQYRILDVETGFDVKDPNKQGELLLKSSCMMKGYYRNPEATADMIDSNGWLHTGDLVKVDEEGYLYIIDRLKEVFKYMGYGIAPATIEGVINNHPGVKEAVVVGLDNKDSGHIPMAIVQKSENSTVTAQEIKDLVKSKLAFYCELRGGVAFVESFDMTPSGKVRRNIVRQNSLELPKE